MICQSLISYVIQALPFNANKLYGNAGKKVTMTYVITTLVQLQPLHQTVITLAVIHNMLKQTIFKKNSDFIQ